MSEQSVKNIKIGSCELIILGTAHISQQSVEDVHRLSQTEKFDCIAVELDKIRYEKLTKKDTSFEKLDVFSVIKQKKAMLLFSTILLSSFQKRLGKVFNVQPGAEMAAAIEESKKLNIPCALVDRAADVTLKRSWALSSFWGKQKIFATLVSMFFTKKDISEKELEELKQSSIQGKVMEEISSFLPNLKKVLLEERDEYIATKILKNMVKHNCQRMLVVLGAAHVPGVCEHLISYKEKQEKSAHTTEMMQKTFSKKIQSLEHIPPSRGVGTVLKYLIPLGIISLFVFGFVNGGRDIGTQNIIEWYLINGGLSLLGAIIALANPITMAVAFFAAPLTSINPFLGVGFVTGLTEAWLRKPTVQDITNLQDLQLSLKVVYKNRITRILLVFLFTTIGSAIGTFVAIPALFP